MSNKEEVSTTQQVLDGKQLVTVPGEKDWSAWIANIAVSHDHWLAYAFQGFQELKEQGFPVKHFVSIGTGSGIDAIGALEIFRPKTVTVTDLAPSILSRAKENLTCYQANGGQTATINYGLGDLCNPLGNQLADLIYANLPNLPVPPELKDKLMENGISAAFYDPETVADIPDKFKRYLLTLQYAFLRQAKKNLKPDGRIALNLGARVPLSLIEDLFISTGYRVKPLTFCLKLQTRAIESIKSYADFERKDTVFAYYRYNESMQKIDENQPRSAQDLVNLLKHQQISASKALSLAEKGELVGYVAMLLCGSQLA